MGLELSLKDRGIRCVFVRILMLLRPKSGQYKVAGRLKGV